MAKKTFRYLETWNTRFGQSQRIVTRDEDGKFLDTVSLSALRKAPTISNR